MDIKHYYRYTGVAAVLLQIFTILSVGLYTNFNWLGSNPISDLGVTEIFCNYSVGLMIAAILMIFYLRYLQTEFGVSRTFTVVFGVGILCEFITGLAPDQAMETNPFSVLSPFHLPAGSILVLIMPVAMWLFARTRGLSASIRRSSLRLCVIYAVLLVPALSLIYSHTLYAMSEAVCLLIFDVWVVAMSSKRWVRQVAGSEIVDEPYATPAA